MQERGQAASKLLVEAVHVLGTSITYCCWGLQATALNLASRLATCPKHRRNPVSAQRQRWKAAVPFVCPGKLRHSLWVQPQSRPFPQRGAVRGGCRR